MAMPQVSKTFTALNETLDLPASLSESGYRFQVIGSGTLIVNLEDSFDGGATYVNIFTKNETTSAIGNMNAAGLYTTSVGPALFVRPRLRCSSFTSGNFTVLAQQVPLGNRRPFADVDVTFSAGGQSRELPSGLALTSSTVIQVIGAGTLTAQLQDNWDLSFGSYFAFMLRNVNNSTTTDMSAAGIYHNLNPYVFKNPRLAVTAFTSGTLRFIVRQSLRGY